MSYELYSKNLFCFENWIPTDRKFYADVNDEASIVIVHKFSAKNIISDADNFKISIPPVLSHDPQRGNDIVLTALGMTFAIDISYYEKGGEGNNGILNLAS